MPTGDGGVNKADVYYQVIRDIPTKIWNSFARQMLKLPDSVIDDIQVDHGKSIQEQRYQMLLRWEQMNGYKATPAELQNLKNQFLQFPERGGESRRAETQPTEAQPYVTHHEPPETQNNAMPTAQPSNRPTQTPSAGYTREQVKYRAILGNVSDKMTSANLRRIKEIFGLTNNNFQSASGLFFHMDDHGLWGAGVNYLEKLTMIQDIMEGISRNDVVRIIEEAKFDICPSLTGDETILRNLAENHDPSLTAEPMEVTDTKPSLTHQQTSHMEQPPSGAQNMTQGPSSSLYKPISQPTAQRPQKRGNNQIQTPSSGDSRGQNLQLGQNSTQMQGAAVHVNNLYILGDGTAFNLPQVTAAGVNQASNRQGKRKRATVADVCKFEGEMRVENSDLVEYEAHLRDERIYPIRNDPKGHVLILSNSEGFSWGAQYDRKGGKKDLDLMTKLWQGLGCQTIVRENKTAKEMKTYLQAFTKQKYHLKSDLAVVIIMSHGGQVEGNTTVVYGVDGQSIPAEDIIALYDNENCKNLQRKPKLFFFQFCRGANADAGTDATDSSLDVSLPVSLGSLMPSCDASDSVPGPAAPVERLPTRSDMMVAFATFAGNTAFRHTDNGSWFINAIANVFMRSACDTHVCDMLTEVKNGLMSRSAHTPDNPETHGCKEMADCRDCLTKQLFLYPGFPQASNDEVDLLL